MVAFLSAPVFNTEGHIERHMVYIDPTIPFLANKHIPLIIFSLFVALFLYLPPLLLLIVYPTALYRKISRRIKPKWRIGIKTYVDTFQSSFKDGTNGTRDYRALSGYILVMLGFLPVLVQGITIAILNDYRITPQYVTIFLIVILTALCSLAQPYKHKVANASAVTVLTIVTALFALSTGLNDPQAGDVARVMILIFTLIPHCALGGYVVWKMFTTCHRRHPSMESGERERLVHSPDNTTVNHSALVETA